MKKFLVLTILFSVAVPVFLSACSQKDQGNNSQKQADVRGESLFKQHCFPCHPDGSNIINPQKTLNKKDLEANSVMTAADVIGKIRNPGPGMTKFDQQTISDDDAKMISEYVLKTFSK